MSLTSVPKYIINLDLPPEKRWIYIIKQYREQILCVYKKMDKMLASVTGSFGLWITQKTINLFGNKPLYYYELKSIANELNIPVNKIIIMQLCYECFSACTSIIIDDKDKLSHPLHIRTMDWDDTFLRPLTINVKFVKNGNLLFEGTTWVGYVGILTGVRPNVGSVSINYRRTKDGNIWHNIWNTLRFNYPVGYLVRECLTICPDYKLLKHNLEQTIIIAPCYIVLTGTISGSGLIIVRDRKKYDSYPINNKKYICQTNIDPKNLNIDNDQNIMMSIERTHLALIKCDSLLNVLDHESEHTIINPEGIIRHFLDYPILNNETIYANVMSPSGPNHSTYINACWIVNPK